MEAPDALRAPITGLCERRIDEHAGRHHLTLFHEGRGFRLVADETGSPMRRSLVDFGDRHLAATLQGPGG